MPRTPAPSARSIRVTAAPIPLLAPVTMHAFPLSPRSTRRPMKSHTVYKTFNTPERREFVRLTDDVQQAVDEAGIAEGFVLVAAMHITAAVWINDDEPGLQADTLEWLDKIAP